MSYYLIQQLDNIERISAALKSTAWELLKGQTGEAP